MQFERRRQSATGCTSYVRFERETDRKTVLPAMDTTSCYTFPIHHSISSNHLSLAA